MNILIAGNLTSLAATLAKELAKRQHRLVLASDDVKKPGIESDAKTIRSFNPSGDIFREAISAYGFDVVIYLSTREEQLYEEGDFDTGKQLDDLRNTLELCKRGRLRHFFYISSTEVFGTAADLSESAIPQPASLNGHTLLAGEAYCRIYHDRFGLNTTIVRVPNIYGPDEKSGLLYSLVVSCEDRNLAIFPAGENSAVSLLHALDVTDLVIRAMDEEYTPEARVVNLSSFQPIQYAELAHQLRNHYPDVQLSFSENRDVYTIPVEVNTARRIYDWVDTRRLENELKDIVAQARRAHLSDEPSRRAITSILSDYPETLRWIELLGGTVLVQFLSQMTGTLIQFKYVDFRLLFVVLMASVYGIRTGLYAALLVSLSILYTWNQLGFDWALLIYNVGNWLPFALYFMAGLILGYYHDKSVNDIAQAEKQTKLIYDKYAFLYEVFQDIRRLKDEFRERLLGYRDSYGKVYTITRKLDEFEEHAVYLQALSILEEYMDNRDIAIYTLSANRSYARLEASSMSLNGHASKSLDLSKFPELSSYIEKGNIFQNKDLLRGYPAYVVPIQNYPYPLNVPAALIVLWSAKFEQYSTSYYNRLMVICGLIQASLVRATMFSDATHEKDFLPRTRVLHYEAFLDALKVRVEMRKNRIADFQLIRMENPKESPREAYSWISEAIRTNDVIGIGRDGDLYVLLTQADMSAAEDIVERLAKSGVPSKLVDANQVLVN